MTAFSLPEPDLATRDLVAGLGLMYLRHGDPSRALALGMAAMMVGAPSPALALMIADAFLKVGDPEQAEAVLSRFRTDPDTLLSDAPTDVQWAACCALEAKVAWFAGRSDEAKTLLAKANALIEDPA